MVQRVKSFSFSVMSKRTAVAKQRIQQFYFQLTEGCGRSNCTNPDCASNPSAKKLSSDFAAAKAMILFKEKRSLCDKPPSKVARTDIKSQHTSQDFSSNNNFDTKNNIGVKNNASASIFNSEVPSNGNLLTCSDTIAQFAAASSSSSDLPTKVTKKVNISEEPLKSLPDGSTTVNKNESFQEPLSSSMSDDNISKKLKNIFVTKPNIYSGPTIGNKLYLFLLIIMFIKIEVKY